LESAWALRRWVILVLSLPVLHPYQVRKYDIVCAETNYGICFGMAVAPSSFLRHTNLHALEWNNWLAIRIGQWRNIDEKMNIIVFHCLLGGLFECVPSLKEMELIDGYKQ